MEFTLDQALQKGIEAHKAGNAQEADRFYTAIIKANPKHPDANHNMGVLAVGIGKVEEALPFFKTALAANPTVAQYWLSYIEALVKLNQVDKARAIFEEARSSGAAGDKFDEIEAQLSLLKQQNKIDQKSSKHQNKTAKDESNALSKTTKSQTTKSDDLPLKQQKLIMNLYKKGQLRKVLKKSKSLVNQYPTSLSLWNLIGASASQLGLHDQAVTAFQKSINIEPNHAESHYNLGIVLTSQSKLEEAIKAYTTAVNIMPNNARCWHNMGNVLKAQGKLEEAIKAYTTAVSIKPDHDRAYINMGNALKDQGKLEQAIGAYKKAYSINPDNADAYYSEGNALKDQGKLDQAIETYQKAVSIKPDFAEAHNNMGLSLHHKGEPSDAIVAYKKALSIEPDNTMSWNNILFPLQAIKTQVTPGNELASYLPEEDGSNYNSISRAVLWYKLNRSADKGENITDDVLKKLSTANNQIIKNPHNHDKLSKIDTLAPKKFVAMTHCGRSGTGLLHSLIDGHPQISTLPSIYFSEYFDHSAWEKIIAGGWNEIADRFIEIYEVLFDASSSKPVDGAGKISIKNIGHRMGMTRVGDEGNETLKVDKKVFRSELNRLMGFYNELNNTTFFELVHAAYDKSINDFNEKSQIFYHIHNPDTYAHLNFLRMVPDAQRIIMVREPIQSCESWIRNRFNEDDYNSCAVRILFMLFEINNDIYERQETIGLRLEDLKDHPKQTIAALCKWMAIEETDSLYEMTAQGKKWWGDPASPDYSKEGMNPFGKTAIKRETGIIFSDRDQFVLRTLFHPFRVRFSYVEENIEQFKVDLRKIKPMLDDMFDFEKTIIERTTGDYEKFMKSGPYMYFRSGLLERWNTLNEFGTYPTMIKQLQIN